MKIISVRFKNINSLKGEHYINFAEAPIGDAGIFAITGATGSGKTTILDAISLALYDTTPRMKSITNSVIEKTGAILTRNTKEAFAEVEYQCKQGVFVSKWGVRTRRTGTLAPPEMEIADANGTIITTHKKDAPKKNEELIGLSYDQFIRSILLAQGEFAKFLTEKKDARSELLKQITGAWIYEEIGKKAFEMFKKHGEQLKTFNQKKDLLLETKIKEEDFESLTTAYAKSKKELTLLEGQLEKTSQTILAKKAVAQLESDLAKAKTANREHEEKLKSFVKEKGQALSKHRALSPILDDLRNWKQTTDLAFTQKENLQQLEKKSKTIAIELQAFKTRAAKFVHKPVQDFLKDLIEFEQKVLKLENEKVTVGIKYRNTFSEAKRLLQELGLPVNEKAMTQATKDLNKQKLETQKKTTAFKKIIKKEDLANPDQALSKSQETREKLIEYQSLDGQLVKAKAQFSKIQQEQAPILTVLEKMPSKIELAKANEAKYKAELDSLLKAEQIALLQRELTEHRHLLEDGKECPLCGAKKHPYSVDYQPDTDNKVKKEIQAINTKLEAETKAIVQMSAELKLKKERLEAIEEDIKKTVSEIQEAQNKINQLKKSIPQQTDKAFADILADNQKYQLVLKQWAEHLRLIQNQELLSPLLDLSIELLQKGKDLKLKIEKIYSGTDIRGDIEKAKKKWNYLEKKEQFNTLNITKLKKELSENDVLVKKLSAKIQPKISNSIPDTFSDILSEKDYRELSNQEKEIQSLAQQSKTEIKTLQSQLKESKVTDPTPIADWITKQTSLRSKFSEVKSLRDEQHIQFSEQSNLRKNLEALEKEIKAQEKQNLKWVLLNDYIGDSTGKKFNSFAQELTLHQLIHLANTRLETLNNRYQLAVPNDTEDESLTLIDLDMGGERRSVMTLSGGEQFIVSLALALALSDLASRHIEINTLFIDEGFGSLDAQLLDSIIDTLEKLQSESQKAIGIISHVPALQERITTQIRVVKNGQGHSSLSVING